MPPKAAMKNQKKSGKSSLAKDDFGGVDPELMLSIVNKIPPNPVTGRVDLSDIMNYMSQDPSQLEDLMSQMKTVELDESAKNFSDFNFASLAGGIIHESFWVIQLQNMGMVDEAGNMVDPVQADKSPSGLRPSFIIYIYDEKGSYRLTEECVGLPNSKTVLHAIQRAIAKPLPPLKPSLPWLLLLSIKFKQHTDVLKPFLDSLPPPFHWRYETAEEAEQVAEGKSQKDRDFFKKAIQDAEELKKAGNSAFKRRDRAAAMDAYSKAAQCLDYALTLNPEVDEAKVAKRQLAICFANRAACQLLKGNAVDIKGALTDGEQAEKVDPSYNKAYIRQATAYQAMGKLDEAQDAIVRALRRPDLENDTGLVDRLIDLLTGGKGFSNDEAVFKNWMLDICINDEKSRERLAGLNGEWRRRCNAHFAKFKR